MRTPIVSLRLLAVAALAVCVCAISGCSNAALSLYPEFPAKKAAITESMMIADYVIMDATMGDTVIVDIAANKTMAIEIMDQMSEQLNERDYKIGNKLLGSMGLLMNQSTTAKVMQTPEERELDEELLGLTRPPFYVYRVFKKDSTLFRLLAGFYSSLINSVKLEGQSSPVIREAVPLGASIGGGTWFVLLAGGYNIPVGRELAIGSNQESLTLGKVGTHEITQITMMLYVVDMKTGELLWSDQRHEIGGTVHRERLLRIADKVTNSLP
jgi:PBP1b-binding outer membrane lipoprotein LpoB